MKVVRLSALRTLHVYPLRNVPGSHFCNVGVDSMAIVGPARLCQ